MNERELEVIMEGILDDALTNVANKILKLLQTIINEVVYKDKTPEMYKRTYEFRDKAYEIMPTKEAKNIVKEILYNPSNLTYNGDTYTHGGKRKDRRDILNSILDDPKLNRNRSNFGGALNIDDNGSYWDKFIDELDKQIWKWLDEEFKDLTR